MKKVLLLLVFTCYFTHLYSQDQPLNKKDFSFEPSGKIQFIYPLQFGNHSLAKAHEVSYGLGISLSFFNYKNFRFSPGFDRVEYKVSNNSLVGNFQYSTYRSIYGSVSYEIPVIKTISILPDVGIGYVSVRQKTGNRGFGNQEGKEFRAGLTADYAANPHMSVYLSARYINSDLIISTNREFLDFYGNANQIQLALGIRIH